MQKRSSKSESTQKTEQKRSCWKILTMVKVNGQSQRSTIKVNGQLLTWRVWRHLGLTWQEVTQQQAREWEWSGAWGRVAGIDGAWRRVEACSRGWNFKRRVGARVMWFLAILGWVLLGIGCSVALCLCFRSWISRTMISKSCRDCGRASGDSLLSVTTGWRQGQRKNARDVHRNQKVRGMALIPC